MAKKKSNVKVAITIEEKIRRERCRILRQRNIGGYLHRKKWIQVWEIYRSRTVDPNFVESEHWRRDPQLLEKLKRRAEEVLRSEYSRKTHDLYLMAKKWCVVPHTLGMRAWRMGFTFLNMDLDSDQDYEIWEMRINDYNPYENEINLIPLLRMDDPKISMPRKIKNLKIAASKLINLMNYEEYAEEAWNSITRWFTKKRPYRELIV